MTLNRVAIPSPNYSSRGGTAVRLIVLHTAEGALTYQSLGNFFANPSSGVSSHAGIDDTPGTIGVYVKRGDKAWTQANANPYSVSAELCAFAAWSPADWHAHPQMLVNCGAWIAEESAAFGIPIRALSAAEAQGGAAGVCQHVDLGASGGNHWDCGPGFPMAEVVAMAATGTPTAPPSASSEEDNMICSDDRTGGVWIALRSGAVYTEDGAPYLGGTNNAKVNPQNFPCVGIDRWSDGYVLVLDFGEPPQPADARFRTYHFPRDGSAIA